MIVALCDRCGGIIGREVEPQSFRVISKFMGTVGSTPLDISVLIDCFKDGEPLHICKVCAVSIIAEILAQQPDTKGKQRSPK